MANPAIFFGDDPAMTSDVLQEDGGRGDVEDDNLPAMRPGPFGIWLAGRYVENH